MKRLLPAAAVFLSAAILALPALAIDIQIGGVGDDDDIDVMIGTPEDVDANIDENPFANPNARMNANAVPVRTIQLRAAEGVCAVPAAFTGPPCPPTNFVLVDGQTIGGTLMFTNDGTEIGTIYGAGTTVDGETMILIDVNQAWSADILRAAIRLPSLYTAEAGYVLQTTEADLRSSITAALEGAAAAAAAPATTPAPAGVTIPGGAPGAAPPVVNTPAGPAPTPAP